MFLIEVLAFTFYGGMFEMVIGAYRQQRGVEFADLFSGFRKFGSYALYALVMAAIQFGLGLLNILPFIGWIISLVLMLWITIIWLYVLPLIADHGLSFMEAAGRSQQHGERCGLVVDVRDDDPPLARRGDRHRDRRDAVGHVRQGGRHGRRRRRASCCSSCSACSSRRTRSAT